MTYLPELADEENEHDPEERGCSSRRHQNYHLNIWFSFIPWKEKNCCQLPHLIDKNCVLFIISLLLHVWGFLGECDQDKGVCDKFAKSMASDWY